MVSVIIPHTDHRGHWIDSVKTWNRQSYPRQAFELILVCKDNDPELIRVTREVIEPQDKILYHNSDDRNVAYKIAAQAASGRYLFLTESHVEADVHCLQEGLDFVNRDDLAGACCVTRDLATGYISSMEDRLYSKDFKIKSQGWHWNRVEVRGFIIKRDAYFQVGEIADDLGEYGSIDLGIRLHRSGYKLGVARRAIVGHYGNGSLVNVLHYRHIYGFGEMKYRSLRSGEYCEPYLGPSTEWSECSGSRSKSAGRILGVLVPGIFRYAGDLEFRLLWLKNLAGLLEYLGKYLGGKHGSPWVSRARIAWAYLRIRCLFWNADRAFDAYVDLWNQGQRLGKLKFIRQYESPPPKVCTPQQVYGLATIDSRRLVGFHPPEQTPHGTFCWSRPIAMMQLNVAADDYDVQVKTIGSRPPEIARCLHIFFNRYKVYSDSAESKTGLIKFSVSRAMFQSRDDTQYLLFVCVPFYPSQQGSDDQRVLGLPLSSVEFRGK